MDEEDLQQIAVRPLCDVDIRLAEDAPLPLGKSPWRNRRLSVIAGGRFEGPRLAGEVLPGGGDWSELGQDAAGDAVTLIDVRSAWRTDDGVLIHVTYTGRLVIPADVLTDFRDPQSVEQIPPDRYHFRIQPVFEAPEGPYGWLNKVVAVGFGQRTAAGVRYRIYALA